MSVAADSETYSSDTESDQVIADTHSNATNRDAAHVIVYADSDNAESDSVDSPSTSRRQSERESAYISPAFLVRNPDRRVDSRCFSQVPIAVIQPETDNATRVTDADSNVVDGEVQGIRALRVGGVCAKSARSNEHSLEVCLHHGGVKWESVGPRDDYVADAVVVSASGVTLMQKPSGRTEEGGGPTRI
jgi:hypothetical protein